MVVYLKEYMAWCPCGAGFRCCRMNDETRLKDDRKGDRAGGAGDYYDRHAALDLSTGRIWA